MQINLKNVFFSSALFMLGSMVAGSGYAAEPPKFPNKPIKLIAPFAPGGALDVVARTTGEVISEQLGQPVIVENHAGAAGLSARSMLLSKHLMVTPCFWVQRPPMVSIQFCKNYPMIRSKTLLQFHWWPRSLIFLWSILNFPSTTSQSSSPTQNLAAGLPLDRQEMALPTIWPVN